MLKETATASTAVAKAAKIEPIFAPKQVKELKTAAANLAAITKVETPEERKTVDELVKAAKGIKKQFAEVRLGFTRELDNRKNILMEMEKAAVAPLDSAIKGGEQLVTDFLRAEFQRKEQEAKAQREAIEAQAVLDAASTKSTAKTTTIFQTAVAATAAIAAPKVEGGRVVRTFEITNPELVPREFLMVDEAKIRAAVNNGAEVIPGVKISSDIQRSGR